MDRILKNIVCHAPKLLSDKKFIELQWEMRNGTALDLDNPVTFNEKMQWLKAFDHRQEYFMMADKIEVKEFVASIIGQEHIIPTIAVYDKVSQIDWDSLPDRFVLKCSHDSGGSVICRDKDNFDKDKVQKFLKSCLKRNYFYQSGEWCYKGIRPRILCEQFMSDVSQKDSLVDYKFFCFNGVPEFLYVSYGLENHATASISFTDMQGRRAPFHRKDYKEVADPLPLPASFDRMKALAETLAKAVGNSFIRVDLYEIGSEIYFSEFTFYPNGGFIPFDPPEWDRKLGDLINL